MYGVITKMDEWRICKTEINFQKSIFPRILRRMYTNEAKFNIILQNRLYVSVILVFGNSSRWVFRVDTSFGLLCLWQLGKQVTRRNGQCT